jgi:uncharacterized protein (DUF362 family)
MNIDRRAFVAGCAGTAGAAGFLAFARRRSYSRVTTPPVSRVAVLRCENYGGPLCGLLTDGLALFHLDVRGKTVLLKPNLVEHLPGREVNTHPALVSAAADCFRRLGASQVVVAEGPGHHRDTQFLLSVSGLENHLRPLGIRFVDLNRDDLVKTPLQARYSGLRHLWLPKTVLAADIIVSMPKVKTHHWAGITLSMKNMFGTVPGARYGWPKNLLHWSGIHESVLDICATVRPHFVIADGVVAMEGNGPLHGTARNLGRIVLADDPVAADATCARLMGLAPERVPHIQEAASFLGNVEPRRIQQLAEAVDPNGRPFTVLPEMRHLVTDNPGLSEAE